MSNSRFVSSGKAEVSTSTIGFKFHANDEELTEVQLKQENLDDKDAETSETLKLNAVNLTPEIQLNAKAEDDNDIVPDTVRDHWNLLGRKSSSIDSNYESAFSNPIETWKRLNVLKEKIAKTVEEKISEIKIDRSVLGKSTRNKLIHSKDNSSISDSEDTSESSKMSEQWKDAENQISSLYSLTNENSETCSSLLNNPEVENVKEERQTGGNKSELRNRKSLANFSELINFSDIKVATAKSDIDGSLLDESLTEVESGVEAAEHLESTDTDSVDVFDGSTARSGGGSQTPPGGSFLRTIASIISIISSNSHIIVLLLSFILYFTFPLPDFVRGFLLSFCLVLLWGKIKSYVRFDDASFSQQKSFIMPDYKSMPPLRVPQHKPVKGVWVNEYESELYDPDYYSVSQTVPAYLELDDSILKLSRPKGKIHKRATFDEPEYKLQFISWKTYNISGCNVYLMPDGLTRKRLFSKKYPIVIFLRPDSLISESKNGKEVEEKCISESVEAEEVSFTAAESPKSKSSLYLFARCDRQKQEWYRRLLAATRLSTSPVSRKNGRIPEMVEDTDNSDESPLKEASTPFENLFFDDDVAVLEEYLHYMTKFVDVELNHNEVKVKPHSLWYRKQKMKKRDAPDQEDSVDHLSMKNTPESFKRAKISPGSLKSEGTEDKKLEEICQPSIQIQWFNAFVNRILFDVFRSPYWLSKIHDKLQRKLNSIRLPYYIEDIEVVEMDLGKTGPIFHRVSQPCVDELGLWFDMDATFDGLIRLTIQTHLNLVKLQRGIEENETVQIPEKLKKEKKKQKEAKDAFLVKESKEKSNEYITEKSKKFPKPVLQTSSHEKSPEEFSPNHVNCELECKSRENFTHKLIEEVAQFAEIAVEESFGEMKERGSKLTTGSIRCEDSQNLRSPIYDSEVEDSAESSDEDEEEDGHSPHPQDPEEQSCSMHTSLRYPKDRRSSKRIFKVFENVAQSKYFRTMAQSKYIQKAIAGVSAARLRLTLELKSCTGTLAINVPPPPSDRFWYGFREMPKLIFSANPKIGDKALRFSHIRNYLQKKILRELKAKMVRPNMISFVCSPLEREELRPIFTNVPRFPSASGKKVMVAPNMIDFVLPTSVEAQSSNSPQFDDPDLQEATP